jgi:FkbH-like protein
VTTRTTHQSNPNPTPFRFAIAATFTAEPIRPTIVFWGRQLRVDFDVAFAPYNQVPQTLLDPASSFGSNTHGVNVVLVRLEDLGQFRPGNHDSEAKLRANIEHLVDELRSAPARLSAPLLVCLSPPSPQAADRSLADSFVASLQGAPGLHAIHYDEIRRLYPVDAVHNPEGERLGKIPYSEQFFCALGTMVVRYARALVRAPFKVIALDADNTLWQGICGEDGPEGVVLDDSRRELHEFMLHQRKSGMLLTLASKNNEEDVLETFRVHPEMPLQPRHFVTWRLNWESKGGNLVSIAQQLNLGLDSFIFVDDNPKECAEVEQAVPEVVTIPLPLDTSQTSRFLRHVWAFDHPVVTAEDRKRSASYEQLAEFGNEMLRAGSLKQFIASLNLRVHVSPLRPSKLPRVAQLTQRTNQFNLTTIRRSEADVQKLSEHGFECYTAEVSDRFGDYGLVGVLIAAQRDGRYVIDTMLLSCRVLGRGVEHRLLAFAGQTAADRGLGVVEVPCIRTPRNQPARDFLESLGFGERIDTEDGFRIFLPAGQLAEYRWEPTVAETGTGAPASTGEVHRRDIDYARIASELWSVPLILEAMRSSTRSIAVDGSMTDTERQLAGIWSELLDRPSIRKSDSFFDLGGHSLLAVLLLLRIRETFDVELSIDDVYTGSLTLSDLASRIDAAKLGDIDSEEYAALLAEIENLTDEEARELLARENPDQSA